jgi:nitrogen regulatory protein PII
MEALKKVQIIISSLEADEIIEVFERHGHNAYTRIEDIKGRGERGTQDGQGLARAFSNDMLIFIVPDQTFESVREELRELMQEYGGLCLVSTVESLLH